MSFTELKSGAAGPASLPEALGEHPFLAFEASRGHLLLSLLHGPLHPSSRPAMLHLSDPSFVLISLSDHSPGKGFLLLRIYVIRTGPPRKSKIISKHP